MGVGTTDERNSELNRAIGTINRKAPAFLQGLLSRVAVELSLCLACVGVSNLALLHVAVLR